MDRRLPRDYTVRLANTHFIDIPSGTVHQHQVYAFLRYLVQRGGIKRIIDIGCGSAEKLKGLDGEVEILCLDAAPMRPLVALNVPSARFIECDLEVGLPELAEYLPDSVVVCSDVIEHLRQPEILIRQLGDLSRSCSFLLLSTPDRVRARGLLDMGPPGNQAHTMEWSADELGRFLSDCGFSPGFLGYTFNNNVDLAKNTILAIGGRDATFVRGDQNLTVAAIINAYNERDVIESVARHLFTQGIEVHIADNWSTDGTWEILTDLHREGICKNVFRYPDKPSPEYDWTGLLRNTAQYASRLTADWILHYDADEIRTSPWKSTTLAEGITFVDSIGYSAIDFTVINFAFTDEECPRHFSPERMRFFDFARHQAHLSQVKAWKNHGQVVDLASSGGHLASFPGSRVCPLKFLTSHYPLRSVAHASTKVFKDRLPRVKREKRELGWHNHYDTFLEMPVIKPWRSYELNNFDPNVFDAEFLIERLSGVGIETENRSIPNLNTVFEFLNAAQIQRQESEMLRLHSQNDLTALREENALLRNQLRQITSSRSWKLTEPMRGLKQRLLAGPSRSKDLKS